MTRLDGFALDETRRVFVPLAPLPNGDLPCEPLGLTLGVWRGAHHGIDAPWLRWIGPDGHPLPSGEETALEAVDRAAAETRRAQAETERAQAEAGRARAEAERADAAEREAAEQRHRADALAARLAELERQAGSAR